MPNQIPATIRGQKYISLKTFRKNGVAVATPVWFGEENEKLYVMTRSNSGKYKRIRNNSSVRVVPCSIRGVVTGTELPAVARLLPEQEHAGAHATINRKYWAAWITSWFSRADVFIEVSFE
jgi:PPOX class probable F420-dependent enzyme